MSIADNGVGINRSSIDTVAMTATRPAIPLWPKRWPTHSINCWFFTRFFAAFPRRALPYPANPPLSVTARCVPRTGKKTATSAIEIARLRIDGRHSLRRLYIEGGKEAFATNGKIRDELKLVAAVNGIRLELIMGPPRFLLNNHDHGPF